MGYQRLVFALQGGIIQRRFNPSKLLGAISGIQLLATILVIQQQNF
jgi:hypothetical protein